MSGYADPADPRNGPSWHSGKLCVERGCQEPAGTAWSPYFCFRHNVERFERIDRGFAEVASRLAHPGATEAPTQETNGFVIEELCDADD